MSCESNSVLAATLANNGTCPITGERILKPEAVTNVLLLMYSCGMSIYLGQFAFQATQMSFYIQRFIFLSF
jgi:glutaminase